MSARRRPLWSSEPEDDLDADDRADLQDDVDRDEEEIENDGEEEARD